MIRHPEFCFDRHKPHSDLANSQRDAQARREVA